jgi:RHS repeat-associated protein
VTDTITSTYNADDELTQAVDANTGTTVYGYDANGSQTSVTHTPNGTTTPDSTTTNEYDLQGQLAGSQVTTSAGTATTTYFYDDSGNRTEETTTSVSGTLTSVYYLVDVNNPTGYSQPIEQSSTPGTPQITYVWGAQLISEAYAQGATIPGVGTASSPTTYYLLQDAHGSTRLITDANGNIVARYNYDASGNALGFSAATALTTYLYSSMPFDAASGNYYDHARFYDSGTGSFTQSDFGYAGSLANPMSDLSYMFAGGDPINMLDLSGHFTIGGTISAIGDLAMLVAVRLAPYANAMNTARLVVGAATFISFAADPQAAQQFIATGGNPAELVDDLVATAGRAGAADVVVMGRSLLADAKALQLDATAEYQSLMGYISDTSGGLFQQQVMGNLADAENEITYAAGAVNVQPDLEVGTRYGVADIKNVVKITNSLQIKGFASLAAQNKLPFSLIISPRTRYISGPVITAIRSSSGTIWEFDPAGSTWTYIPFPLKQGAPWTR